MTTETGINNELKAWETLTADLVEHLRQDHATKEEVRETLSMALKSVIKHNQSEWSPDDNGFVTIIVPGKAV
jgi:predicted small metal-binding protein